MSLCGEYVFYTYASQSEITNLDLLNLFFQLDINYLQITASL